MLLQRPAALKVLHDAAVPVPGSVLAQVWSVPGVWELFPVLALAAAYGAAAGFRPVPVWGWAYDAVPGSHRAPALVMVYAAALVFRLDLVRDVCVES